MKKFIHKPKSESKPLSIGHVENTTPGDIVRIVHISDTHMNHNVLLNTLPMGDILIHSGDFLNFYVPDGGRYDLELGMTKINNFFGKLPHRHKIFVAGNHESALHGFTDTEISELLPNGIYICDESVTLDGVVIYGSPWNNAEGGAFYKEDLQPLWEAIPDVVDILVTHLPPFGIKDLGYNKYWGYRDHEEWLCEFCTSHNTFKKAVYHGDYAHQGCPHLKNEIFNRIKPKAHLFGHVHNKNGVCWHKNILFSNAAMACVSRPIVIDFHKPPNNSRAHESTSVR